MTGKIWSLSPFHVPTSVIQFTRIEKKIMMSVFPLSFREEVPSNGVA
jgi:hypothetical protein